MARFGFKAEDLRLWSLVTATVRPHKAAKLEQSAPVQIETVKIPGMPDMVAESPKPFPTTPFQLGQSTPRPNSLRSVRSADLAPDPIEPKRKRRLSRERDPIEARLDLHGMTAFAAEARLKAFVLQAYVNDYRAILVITGKGLSENGILKRNAPEWLADPTLSHIIAGISQAHARHGGAGALYVALRRRTS